MKKTISLICVFLLAFSIVSASALDFLSVLHLLILPVSQAPSSSSFTNTLQKQQQTLQTLSNIAKMKHDATMAVIRAIGG